MKLTPARILGLLVAVAVFALDQGVKFGVARLLGIDHALVHRFLADGIGLDGLGYVRTLLPIFDLRFVPNIGVSLGLLPADGVTMRWVLVALTGCIAAGVAWWMSRETHRQDLVALGLVLGGAIGNIVDRVRLGYVVDFADLHFGTWRPFLVFNVADAAITVGVLILLIRALLVRDRSKAKPASVENKLNA